MSQYWHSFREPEVAIADDFDLLQAINSNPHETLYETPSFGEETSFSDAALSNVCSGYDAVEHRGMNDILVHNPQAVQTRKVKTFHFYLFFCFIVCTCLQVIKIPRTLMFTSLSNCFHPPSDQRLMLHS